MKLHSDKPADFCEWTVGKALIGRYGHVPALDADQ